MSEIIKEYCIMSMEAVEAMKGIRGKMCAQAGHAYLHSFFDALKRFPADAQAYMDSDHAYKITLVVENEAALEILRDAYQDKCGVALIKDAGFTVFKDENGNPKPTVTCLGIGPIRASIIGPDIKALKTFT